MFVHFSPVAAEEKSRMEEEARRTGDKDGLMGGERGWV